MVETCEHLGEVQPVTPGSLGCEECLAAATWVHLRLCRTCGHVGCCDSSPNRHATKHFHATGHPIIEGYDPPEGWGWCYVDEVFLDLARHDAAARPDSALRVVRPHKRSEQRLLPTQCGHSPRSAYFVPDVRSNLRHNSKPTSGPSCLP